ncbi:MAG: rRNA maturation RNase YbeY [Bacteroidota bacterium]
MISFFSENITYKLKDKRKIQKWIKLVIEGEKKKAGDINYIFCDDAFLTEMNIKYLNHDTLTDIITFNYNEENNNLITGDIYISIDRVKYNSEKFKVLFSTELERVIIHGVLHLLGFKDKTKADKMTMRDKEDNSLSLLHNFINIM